MKTKFAFLMASTVALGFAAVAGHADPQAGHQPLVVKGP